ncbi:unnamed protein product, partial [Ectocarpus sp. 8 AP-2014]
HRSVPPGLAAQRGLALAAAAAAAAGVGAAAGGETVKVSRPRRTPKVPKYLTEGMVGDGGTDAPVRSIAGKGKKRKDGRVGGSAGMRQARKSQKRGGGGGGSELEQQRPAAPAERQPSRKKMPAALAQAESASGSMNMQQGVRGAQSLPPGQRCHSTYAYHNDTRLESGSNSWPRAPVAEQGRRGVSVSLGLDGPPQGPLLSQSVSRGKDWYSSAADRGAATPIYVPDGSRMTAAGSGSDSFAHHRPLEIQQQQQQQRQRHEQESGASISNSSISSISSSGGLGHGTAQRESRQTPPNRRQGQQQHHQHRARWEVGGSAIGARVTPPGQGAAAARPPAGELGASGRQQVLADGPSRGHAGLRLGVMGMFEGSAAGRTSAGGVGGVASSSPRAGGQG